MLTYVWCDNGEGAQVGLPHVLCQCVCVLLVVAQQRRRAALPVLDQLPVWLRLWRQDGAPHTDQVLSESGDSSVRQHVTTEREMKYDASLQTLHERL